MPNLKLSVPQIIEMLHLEPLTMEGGLFVQSYCSSETIPLHTLPDRYPPTPRPYGTAIYYLLTPDPDSFSALHRLPTDELYHFYLGDPVEMLQLFPDGTSKHVILGQDIAAGQHVQYVAPRGVWQGSRLQPGGDYALIGTTMAPGFLYSDFDAGSLETLRSAYPQESDFIRQLTRS